jgi:cytochrome c oxidase subunit 1
MAIAELPQSGPLALPGGDGASSHTAPEALGCFARPRVRTAGRPGSPGRPQEGRHHVRAAALFFFLVGGVEALIVRSQLAVPNGKLISADFYNQAFTMHGVTMVFLVIMPLGACFMNYLMPLQVGARTSPSRA